MDDAFLGDMLAIIQVFAVISIWILHWMDKNHGLESLAFASGSCPLNGAKH